MLTASLKGGTRLALRDGFAPYHFQIFSIQICSFPLSILNKCCHFWILAVAGDFFPMVEWFTSLSHVCRRTDCEHNCTADF